MTPIKDETVDSLRDLVHKLESRVQQLESRVDGSGGGSGQQTKRDGSSMRMVLMGPPGAGTGNHFRLLFYLPLTRSYRQRHSSPKNKGKVLRVSSGIYSIHRL